MWAPQRNLRWQAVMVCRLKPGLFEIRLSAEVFFF